MRRFLRDKQEIGYVLTAQASTRSWSYHASRTPNLLPAHLLWRHAALRVALFWLALSLVSPSRVFASGNKLIPYRRYESWGRAAGFPGGDVYSMAQTGDGYLWIGTSKGLVRYDGLTFVPIRENDSTQDVSSPVVGLVTDSAGQLWITDDHSRLFRYSGGRLLGPLLDSGGRLHRTGPVNRTNEGSLLFVSETLGLVEYKGGATHVLSGPRGIPGSPTAVAQTSDGTFWIGSRDRGIFFVNVIRGDRDVRRVPDLPDMKVNCLLPIGGSTLLVGTDSGLFGLHNGRLIQEFLPELNRLTIRALANSSQGEVWIGTDSGLFGAEAKQHRRRRQNPFAGSLGGELSGVVVIRRQGRKSMDRGAGDHPTLSGWRLCHLPGFLTVAIAQLWLDLRRRSGESVVCASGRWLVPP